MIHAKRQIDDARQILGTNYRYASITGNSFAAVQEWTWDCRDGDDFALNWDRCGGHA
jgi:hypothetical protein